MHIEKWKPNITNNDMWMTRIEIKSYWEPVNHLKDRHDVRIWNTESYTTSSLKDKNLLQSAQFTSHSPHARSVVAGWPWTQRVHYPSNSLRLTEGFHINLTAAALRTHEKPLQMTGSLHTNTQRRHQNISQTSCFLWPALGIRRKLWETPGGWKWRGRS